VNEHFGRKERLERQRLDQVFYCAGEPALQLHYARSCKSIGEVNSIWSTI